MACKLKSFLFFFRMRDLLQHLSVSNRAYHLPATFLRWRRPGVRGGGDLSDAADAVAEDGERRVPAGVFGAGAHSARPGGTLPVPEGQRPEGPHEEGEGQEDQEEMSTRHRTI